MDRWRQLYLRLRYDAFLTFFLGALTAGVVQIISGDLWQRLGLAGLLIVLLLIVGAFLVYRLVLWLIHKLLPPARYPVGKAPEPRRGLIMLLGGGSRETVPVATEHHRPRLEHIWFVTTERTTSLFDDLKRVFASVVAQPEHVVNHWEPVECQNAVERALSHARVLGIEPQELICDLTGGTTAMTVGAIRACLTHKLAAQMVAARYDETLKALTPVGVIELELTQERAETAGQAPAASVVA